MKYLKYTHICLFSLAASSLTVNAGSIAISTFLGPGDISGNTLNLTTLGTSDWAIYGGRVLTPTHIMDGGSGLGAMTSFTPHGTTIREDSSTRSPLYSWTNGDSTASATDFASKQTRFNFEADAGNKFSITAAASDQASTLYLSATSFNADLTLTATLSDGSASPETIVYTAVSARSFVYKVDFTADSIGQTLTLELVQTATENPGIFGVSAVALSTVPEPGTFALLAGCFAFTAVALRRRTM